MISFICSSNNNIPRITKILAAIRSKYGTLIDYPSNKKTNTKGDTDSIDPENTPTEEQEEEKYYSFPTLK